MENMIKSAVVLILIMGMSAPAYSGTGGGQVQIAQVGHWSLDKVYFYTSSHIDPPACNTYHKRWVLDISTDIGRAQYSLLLSAAMSGKDVVIGGRNECDLDSDSESVGWVGFPVVLPE